MNYPFVLIHGYDNFGNSFGKACDIIREQGYECYSPHIGPFTGMWDRACELYAMLKGGTVDYGKVHSKKNHHKRYGKTYRGLIPDWGEMTPEGIKKINMIGHSFGGITIRMLLHLLVEGSAEEREGTEHGNLSPLFEGGHDGWINVVYTLASPHNGTNTMDLIYPLHLAIYFSKYSKANINSGSSKGNANLYDLDRFGFTSDTKHVFYRPIKIARLLLAKEDNVHYELTVEGMDMMTRNFRTYDDTYYFSVAADYTHHLLNSEVAYPISDIPKRYELSSKFMGLYFSHKYDKLWRPNDGRVPVASAMAPYREPSILFDKDYIPRGVWNIMPVEKTFHSAYIGLEQDDETYYEYYANLANFIAGLD